MNIKIISFTIVFLCFAGMKAGIAQNVDDLTAEAIMSSVQQNLKVEKYIYEEISVILTDHAGNRDTRQLRKFARISDNGMVKFLLVFDEPDEYEGVAILVEQTAQAIPSVYIYLPANGELLKHQSLWNDNEGLFGMDFTLSQISNLFDLQYQYVRRADRKIGDVTYFLIDVYEKDDDPVNTSPLKTHQVRQDGHFITQTNYYDNKGKVMKQLSMHDLSKNALKNWNAAMLHMTDRTRLHSTLIKINKRVVSNNLVSEDVFTANWLYENKPPLDLSPSQEEQLESELIDASINKIDNSFVINQARGSQ